MSLNWREISAIIDELPLMTSLIQRVYQIGFHALVFDLHHPREGFWQLYVEVGTQEARIHKISDTSRNYKKMKTKKLQRFIQYIRAHVEGGKIISVVQPAQDRLLIFGISRRDSELNLVCRFFSGPGANVIICDEHMIIRELLFRRPGRDEVTGKPLTIPEKMQDKADSGKFSIREFPTDMSFNEFIEQYYSTTHASEPERLIGQIKNIQSKQIEELQSRLKQISMKLEKINHFESYKTSGDLLSASAHLMQPGESWVTVPDFTAPDEDTVATIAIDSTLSPGENIAAYYKKYQKGKHAWERAQEEKQEIVTQIQNTTDYFNRLLAPLPGTDLPDLEAMKRVVQSSQREEPSHQSDPYSHAPGLHFTSSLFTILVGRNAKENDELLRKWAKGNDWWLHTRDVPGGYVIIKNIAGKTIPLETLLDAGNLAILFSKAKESGSADLYYTQVKYLKRPKGAKRGLVLPTQEKNITVRLESTRIERLFSSTKSDGEAWMISQ